MKQLRRISIWFIIVAMISAMGTGCITGPESKSSSGQNQDSADKSLEDSGYY